MDIIDTRDLIDELTALGIDDEDNAAESLAAIEDEIDRERAGRILELFSELSGGDRPRDGIALIPEGDFEEYAQQVAEDIGVIGDGSPWPVYCIDWERAARDLSQDYAEVDFEGTTYFYR